MQIHHLADAHTFGLYTDFVKVSIDSTKCYSMKGSYKHQMKEPLIAKSRRGVEFTSVPLILSKKGIPHNWFDILSNDEIKIFNDLLVASTDIESMLQFRLNDKYTILDACTKIGNTKELYHNGIPHLQFSIQCMQQCANCHSFPKKIKDCR